MSPWFRGALVLGGIGALAGAAWRIRLNDAAADAPASQWFGAKFDAAIADKVYPAGLVPFAAAAGAGMLGAAMAVGVK